MLFKIYLSVCLVLQNICFYTFFFKFALNILQLAGKFDVEGMKSLKLRDFQHIRFYYLLHLLMRFKVDRKYIER